MRKYNADLVWAIAFIAIGVVSVAVNVVGFINDTPVSPGALMVSDLGYLALALLYFIEVRRNA